MKAYRLADDGPWKMCRIEFRPVWPLLLIGIVALALWG